VVEGPKAPKRKVYAEHDKVVVKYNANALKFHDLYWFDEEYAKTLAAS